MFELDAGRLIPAQVGHAVSEPVEPQVLDAVRAQVLELLELPLFPVTWQDDDGVPRLTAMDAAGQVVSVEVVERLDAPTLVAALGRAGGAGRRGWIDVARSYPRGVGAFRRDWNAFRESRPAGSTSAARAHVVAAAIDDDVRPALDALAGAGVVVHEISARAMSNGRMFLDIAELRTPVSPLPWLLPARPPVPLEQVASALAREQLGVAQEAAEPAPAAGPAEAAPGAAEPATQPAEPAAERATQPAEPATERATQPAEPAAGPAETGADPAQPDEDLASIGATLGGPTPLVWTGRPRQEATLLPEGRIVVAGTAYPCPQAAAAAVGGPSAEADAWDAWRFGESGPSLREAREELRAHRTRRPRPSTGPGLRRRERRRRATSG